MAVVADAHRQDVEDHAVEVHEGVGTHTDVVAVVAEERRADHYAFANTGKVLDQQSMPAVVEQLGAVVVALHPVFVGDLLRL
ncbi:hypothetical protein D3C76_1515200 [compost metagenome]